MFKSGRDIIKGIVEGEGGFVSGSVFELDCFEQKHQQVAVKCVLANKSL